MHPTADQQLLKRLNRAALLRQLHRQQGLSRAQLAQASGLTKSTVSLLVRELLDEGWLLEAESTLAQGLGRPSTPLQLNARNRALLGVEVAVECLRVVAVALDGRVLHQQEVPLPDTGVATVCQAVAQAVAELHTQLGREGCSCAGLGLGVPGAFDEVQGTVRFAPNLGWRDTPFAALLRTALQAQGLGALDLHIQNEADTAALSEYEFAPDEQAGSLIFVTCGAGVGAGIVLNDRLFTGSQGMAGEIGHSVLQVDGRVCSCGRRGCAETFFGARALSSPETAHGAGRYLGVVLQNLWTTFNPSTLVVGGPSCYHYPALVESAQLTLAAYAQDAGIEAPPVRVARYGQLASAVGAAALVLHHLLRPLPNPVFPTAAPPA